jgi:hypothetical protein
MESENMMKVHSCAVLVTYIELKDMSCSCDTKTSYSARYNLEHRTKTIKIIKSDSQVMVQ